MTFPHRGDVYWVSLDPVVGSEIAKTRPAVIVSNDIGNELSPRVIVAPITSRSTERVYPFQALLPAGEAGLPQASKVLLDQVCAIDKRRLGRRAGRVAAERLAEIDRALLISLGLGR